MVGSKFHCLAVRQHLAGDRVVAKCVLLVVMVITIIEQMVVFWTSINCCDNPFKKKVIQIIVLSLVPLKSTET